MRKALCIVGIFVAGVALAQTEKITSPRPLGDAADRLEGAWGRAISYEEPIWTASDVSTAGAGPRSRATEVAAAALTNRDRKQDIAHLKNVAAAFNRANADVSYDVVETVAGYVFVAGRRQQSIAKLSEESRTVLDERITIPIQARTPFGHVSAITEAISSKVHLRVEANTPLLGNGFDKLFSGPQGGLEFQWGVGVEQTARDALMNLLQQSLTSMSWRLNCQPPTLSEKAFCVLNIGPVLIDSTDAVGKTGKTVLQYDRCLKCPPLLPPPPRSGN